MVCDKEFGLGVVCFVLKWSYKVMFKRLTGLGILLFFSIPWNNIPKPIFSWGEGGGG